MQPEQEAEVETTESELKSLLESYYQAGQQIVHGTPIEKAWQNLVIAITYPSKAEQELHAPEIDDFCSLDFEQQQQLVSEHPYLNFDRFHGFVEQAIQMQKQKQALN